MRDDSRGLGPAWQSDNAAVRARATTALEGGGVAAFGLSEKEHGADIYSTDMVLIPDGAGGFRANGSMYYIGNGNAATTVSVFGCIDGLTGPPARCYAGQTPGAYRPPADISTGGARAVLPDRPIASFR